MAYAPRTYHKGDQTRVAETIVEAVYLEFNGWLLEGEIPPGDPMEEVATLRDVVEALLKVSTPGQIEYETIVGAMATETARRLTTEGTPEEADLAAAIFAEVAAQVSIGGVPDIAASKVTSGIFDPDRLGLNAVDGDRVLYSDSTWRVPAVPDGVADHAASKVTSGIFDPDRLGLNAVDGERILYSDSTWRVPPSPGGPPDNSDWLYLSNFVNGDGTDESAGLQEAFDAATGVTAPVLVCDVPGVIHCATGVTLGDERANGQQRSIATLMGSLNIMATANMDALFRFRGTVNTMACEIEADGNHKAAYSAYGENCGRSTLGHIHGFGALVSGYSIQPGPSPDNNNAFTIQKLRVWDCGTKHVTTATVTTRTGTGWSGTDDSAAYTTWTLDNPLPAHVAAKEWTVDTVLFGSDDRAMEVRRVVDATHVEIYNEDRALATTDTLTLATKAIDIPYYGDNGIFFIGHVDVRQNPNAWSSNIGGYGGFIGSYNQQANFGGMSITKKADGLSVGHFYTEQVPDWFVCRDMLGTDIFFGPGTNSAPDDFQIMQRSWMTMVGRTKMPLHWMIFQSGRSPLALPPAIPIDTPELNPGARNLTPGTVQAYRRTSGAMNVRIDNNYQQSVGLVVVAAPSSGAGTDVVFSLLSSGLGHTVMGSSTYTTKAYGAGTMFATWKEAGQTDWKVSTVGAPNDHATRIDAAPVRRGQTADVGGIAYMATGVASTADWKQISN